VETINSSFLVMEKLITVDGLASSGKSTLARKLSKKLHWSWFSTGVLYRGMAYVGFKENFKEKDFFHFFKSKQWEIKLSPLKTLFFYKEEDITDKLYFEDIDEKASLFSFHKAYRKALIPYQRSFYKSSKGLILEGRDCGTILFPKAALKIFLQAPEDQRVERRAKERKKSPSFIFEAQKERDQRDQTRAFAPSIIPEGALTLNSSEYRSEELANIVYKKAQQLFF